MSENLANVVVGKVSTSQLNSFGKCQRAWFFSRLNKFQTNINFTFGSAYHKSIESLKDNGLFQSIVNGITYLNENGFKELLAKEYETEFYSEEQIQELVAVDFQKWEEILESMVKRYKNFLDENGFKIHMSEIEVNYMINKEIRLQCFFDRILEKDGEYYLEESKSGRDVNLSHVPLDFQAGVYLTVADKILDIPIKGLIYTKNKKSVPNEPKVLKSGLLSTDKNQSTTYELYIEKANEIYGADTIPVEILECAEALFNKKGYFDYVFLTKNDKQKKSTLNQLNLRGKELVKAQKLLQKDEKKAFNKVCANYNRDCVSMCDYYEQCLNSDKE